MYYDISFEAELQNQEQYFNIIILNHFNYFEI